MLNQQLKQMQDKLKSLKAKKVITKEDEVVIKNLEKWFEEFKKAE
jgi:hypothetical protein